MVQIMNTHVLVSLIFCEGADVLSFWTWEEYNQNKEICGREPNISPDGGSPISEHSNVGNKDNLLHFHILCTRFHDWSRHTPEKTRKRLSKTSGWQEPLRKVHRTIEGRKWKRGNISAFRSFLPPFFPQRKCYSLNVFPTLIKFNFLEILPDAFL